MPVARCLERGHWVALNIPRNFTSVGFVADSGRYMCLEQREARGLGWERQRWEPAGGANCHRLQDPLTGDFGGVFANSARPVQLALLSDSLGAQVRSALESAKSANRQRLAHLHFARGNSHASATLRPLNLATIPRHARGVESLLSSIEFHGGGRSKKAAAATTATTRASALDAADAAATAATPAPVRIVLASSGMWYNLAPYCNGTGGGSLFGLDANATCGHKVLGHTIRPNDVPLNHSQPMAANPLSFWRQCKRLFTRRAARTLASYSHACCQTRMHAAVEASPIPLETPLCLSLPPFSLVDTLAAADHRHFGTPPWGWYAWARRLQGSATIREYEADLRTFLDASLAWAQAANARVVWMETTPQHFSRDGPRNGCQAAPNTPFAVGSPWPAELQALCDGSITTTAEPAAAAAGLAAARAAASRNRTRAASKVERVEARLEAKVEARAERVESRIERRASAEPRVERVVTECHGDWRNHIARKLLRERGVPVVPLAAALSSRSELHTGGGGDCTHWCEGSEASLFMATAVLNVLAEVVGMLS